MDRLIAPALALLLLAATAACAVPPDPARPWVYTDLRLLQPAAAGLPASADLVAVYTREAGSDLQVRLDFLDLPLVPNQDVYIALERRPGGSAQVLLSPWQTASPDPAGLTATAIPWDMLIALPAAGSPRLFFPGQTSPSSVLVPRLVRDPWLDTLTVSLNGAAVPRPFQLQVFVTRPCASPAGPCDPHPLEGTPAVASDAPPPPGQAALLMAFWDTFPAATPALALRRWDGAHTGPNGGRHGLNLLLTAAGQNFVPLVLLDLKTPASLAALDLVGAMKRLQDMSTDGYAILPDVAYGDPASVSLAYGRQAAAAFGYPASQMLFAPTGAAPTGYLIRFASLVDPTHMALAGAARLVPLPSAEAVQATGEGPSLDVRLELLSAALSGDPSRLVVLGGDLPRSTWGNADAAQASFAWISAHPWIRRLFGPDLLTFPVKGGAVVPAPAAQPAFPTYDGSGGRVPISPDELRNALAQAPRNTLTDLAWQAFFSLTAPTTDAGLQALRAQYLPDVSALLAASRWSDGSLQPDGCLSFQGRAAETCQLGNDRFLAILASRDARLEFLLYRDQLGVHEVIGPSSQFTVGLSDPSEWHPENGPGADPGAIQGAFAEAEAVQFAHYQSDGKSFTASSDSLSKTYRLTENGIEVDYRITSPLTERIPLAVEPQAFYAGPSAYLGRSASGAWSWGLAGGLRVQVQSQAALTEADFTASLPFLSQPEDPNQDYPPGHYLPFPLSVVSLNSDQDFRVLISIK